MSAVANFYGGEFRGKSPNFSPEAFPGGPYFQDSPEFFEQYHRHHHKPHHNRHDRRHHREHYWHEHRHHFDHRRNEWRHNDDNAAQQIGRTLVGLSLVRDVEHDTPGKKPTSPKLQKNNAWAGLVVSIIFGLIFMAPAAMLFSASTNAAGKAVACVLGLFGAAPIVMASMHVRRVHNDEAYAATLGLSSLATSVG
jgi:hypothetical protein